MSDLTHLIERCESGSGRPCLGCGTMMFRGEKQYPYQWRKQRFCSQPCAGGHLSRKRAKSPSEMRDWLFNNADTTSSEGCWVSHIKPCSHGYPATVWGGSPVRLHRVSYELFKGPIPAGMVVCHHCDNRACVNPDHLFLGSSAENNADRDKKGRQARGEKAGRAKLTEKQVLAILADTRVQRVIAGAYGVGETAIQRIKSGQGWKHLHAYANKEGGSDGR